MACKNKNCGCKDSFLTTPPPCPTPEGCATPNPCSEVFDSRCILYTGDPIVCDNDTVVAQNTNVHDALADIVEYFCNQTPTESGLTWLDLTPYLLNGWSNSGGGAFEYAFDSAKKLLYLRGNISKTPNVVNNTAMFIIPAAVLGGSQMSSSNITAAYDYDNSIFRELFIGGSGPDGLKIEYRGGNETLVAVQFNLSTFPVFRLA